MKRNLVIAIAIAGIAATGLFAGPTVQAGALDGPVLAMMGGGGGMMGGGMMGGGRGYNGSGGGHMDNWGNYDRRYDSDRQYDPHRYREDRAPYDRYERRAPRDDHRQQLRDELRRQRRELSQMIHSDKANPDEIDQKLDRIENLERRLETSRW